MLHGYIWTKCDRNQNLGENVETNLKKFKESCYSDQGTVENPVPNHVQNNT
jgi:hypothetical protein